MCLFAELHKRVDSCFCPILESIYICHWLEMYILILYRYMYFLACRTLPQLLTARGHARIFAQLVFKLNQAVTNFGPCPALWRLMKMSCFCF